MPVCIISVSENTTTLVTGTDCDKNSTILSHLGDYLAHLSPTQRKDITTIINKHHDVFGDHPKLCNMTSHDVKLLPGTSPLRHSPYRLHPRKYDQMRQEVDYLLQQGLASPASLHGRHHVFSSPRRMDNCASALITAE